MDPVQRMYQLLQVEKVKVLQNETLISTNTGDLKKAYSTIQSVHISTVNGLTISLQQLLSTSMGSN
jgi:hypothetical protein